MLWKRCNMKNKIQNKKNLIVFLIIIILLIISGIYFYPFSKYAILAELKIADAHFRLEEYEDAIFAYESFESLHPRNEAIPYVIYQIGLCYFKQVDTIDRDQTTAKKALDTFGRLKKQFPNSPYTRNAGSRVKKCLKSLVGRYSLLKRL